MTAVDLWAALAAFAAGSAVAIRARMLRPNHEAWIRAPALVWVALSAVALCLLMTACTIASGAHANAREAMVYTVLAYAGVILVWNLNRTGRLEAAERQRISQQVYLAMQASGPPATYPGEQQ